MKENQRECVKCGASPANDPETKLCRFPKPGSTNITRCEQWAKYCFPEKTWANTDFQRKLYSEHRMLCHRHFNETAFVDFSSKILRCFACPDFEVLQKCFDHGISVAATVCDMDGVNRRALTILGATASNPYFTLNDKRVFTLFDTPHLVKCFRNLFIKYDIECLTNITSSEGVKGRGVAKWSHIARLYELDNSNPNFVYAPGLRQEHINPNKR